MDNNQTMQLVGSFLLGAAVAGGLVYARLASRLKRELQRVHNVEQARQLAAQQVTQARKQVEQLQRECHELRLAVKPIARPVPAPAPVPAVDPAEAARRYAESKLQPAAPPARPTAFKDTEVLSRPAGE